MMFPSVILELMLSLPLRTGYASLKDPESEPLSRIMRYRLGSFLVFFHFA
jgi:hypothetical protein